MRLVTYVVKADELNIQTDDVLGARLGWIQDQYVVDVVFAQKWLMVNKSLSFPHLLPDDLLTLLQRGENELSMLREVYQAMQQEKSIFELSVEGEQVALGLDETILLAPLPQPKSVRDFYSFEQHVKTARARRGLPMIEEWYNFPVFYFSNHSAVFGHKARIAKPKTTQCLDFELEVACVIGKKGINIPKEKAYEYIAGFTIFNDWSARDVQMAEMKVGLGPAKGKDFATSMGPYLVTLDELEDKRVGEHWNLTMIARINGREVSRGNLQDLYWSFADMIARASENVYLYPGDVIASGTVGTGCILELGEEVHRYLEPGDVVELEVERLGRLRNYIV